MNAAHRLELAGVERLDAQRDARHARSAQGLRQVERERLGIRLAGELDGLAIRAHEIDQPNQATPQQRGRSPADVDRLDRGQLPGIAVGIHLGREPLAVRADRFFERASGQCARVEIAVEALGPAKRNMKV